mmetsp:Transcript_9172/g.12190  ORF Transcript_9172/g.12190 Transcript_9172/m.12190 type:complete len:290 (-) Transcript_9172:209-1078(-)
MIIIPSISLLSRIAGAVLLCDPETIEQSLPMLAPFPSSLEELMLRRQVDKVLDHCWQNDNDGFSVSLGDEIIVNQGGTQETVTSSQPFLMDNVASGEEEGERAYRPSTYGEVTALGARQLFDEMGMIVKGKNTQEFTFMDLGSGAGKLVVQASLEVPHLERAIGIELAPSRHQAALVAQSRLHENYSSIIHSLSSSSCLELLEGDLLMGDISEATHIYVSSLCFPPETMQKLEYKLAREVASSRKLQCVATLKAFPGNLLGAPGVRYVEMSWTKPLGNPVYFYSWPFQQ